MPCEPFLLGVGVVFNLLRKLPAYSGAFLLTVDNFCFFVENAPACYRAPTWPDRISMKNTKQNTPRPEILDSQSLPPKYPKNTEKIPRKYPKYVFLVFSRYFGGIFLGFQNFGPNGIFSAFFVEIPGRAILGLCSRSGRS